MSGRSPELEAILERWVRATHAGDGRVVRNILSRDPGALYCGAGPEEVFSAPPSSRSALLAGWH